MTLAAPARAHRTGEWLADPGFGVYVHIPFCRHRCHYCDFNTYEGQDDLHLRYVDALVEEIRRAATSGRAATSVFFGGGTPTLLPPESLGRILDAISESVGISDDAEITVEANPETVDEGVFAGLIDAGFNRVSIGVQSLAAGVLSGLGRTHSAGRALDAIAAARRAGVTDVSADLIFGAPWESDAEWERSLEGIAGAAPDHVSCYALTVETGTPLHTLVATGRVPDVDPDVQAARYETACEVLSGAGYDRYEISNWARPGRASRHNVLYWSGGDYLAFGAGAHGHLDGYRYWRVRLPRDYIAAAEAGASTEAGSEVVADRAAETLMIGLRLASGVPIAEFDRCHPGYLARRAGAVETLGAAGLLERRSGYLRLTARGTFLADGVITRLVETDH